MLQIIRDYREFRQFLDAKKRRREPVKFHAHGAASATCLPPDARGFASLRAGLRQSADFHRASEYLDALEHALLRRGSVGLPLPRKVIQNSDRSLTLFWEGAMVRCLPDGFISLIGGIDGVKAKSVTRELLDLLAFQARIQRAS